MIIRKGKSYVTQVYVMMKSYHLKTGCKKPELFRYKIDGGVVKKI